MQAKTRKQTNIHRQKSIVSYKGEAPHTDRTRIRISDEYVYTLQINEEKKKLWAQINIVFIAHVLLLKDTHSVNQSNVIDLKLN